MSSLNKIEMPEKVSVYEDKKSGAKTIAFPLIFPDKSDGAIMVTRLKKGEWEPLKMIKSITIEFE
jgi:hypothetical protein